MAWITVSDVSEYTGVTYSSTESVVLENIIDAVCGYIENYCDTKFTDAVYAERIHIIDNYFNLSNNLQNFYTVNYGVKEAISITAPNSLCSVVINNDITELSLINGYSKSDLDITSLTLQQVVDAINAESTGLWSATLDVDDDYARVLYPGSSNTDSDNEIKLSIAYNKIGVSKVSNRLFQASVECEEAVAVYQGGFESETFPSDLKDATIRMTVKSYQDKNPTSASGDLKTEKVGDFSYTKFTASELTAGLETLAIDYYSVLDYYRFKSI